MIRRTYDVARLGENLRVERGVFQPDDGGNLQQLGQRMRRVVDAAEEGTKLEDDEWQAGGVGNSLVVAAHDGRVERIVEERRRREDEQRVGTRVTCGLSISRRLRGARSTDSGHNKATAG